jgi:arylesterase/paraoxonase
MNKRRWFVLCWLVVSVLVCLRLLYVGGQFQTLNPHFRGTCRAVANLPGAEDITFHPTLGFAYVSSDDRRSVLAGHPVQGGVYRYDPSSGAEPVLLTASFKQPFHPHGLSLFINGEGKQTLFVVNHPTLSESRIEKFELTTDGLLQHRVTLNDPSLVSANDVAAIDDQRFYVTNDHGTPAGLGHLLEDTITSLLGPSFGRGSVLYFDGKHFRSVLRATAYANGITAARDGKSIVVAQVLAKKLSFFARDASSGTLTLTRELALSTGPDNLEWDDAGNLWLGAHPKSFSFLAHAFDRSGATRAPAQVLRVKLGGAAPLVEEMYLSMGSPLSAAATAAVHGEHMLLGPVFDPIMLHCRRR